jgi:iron complex transport system substrate-binding protein
MTQQSFFSRFLKLLSLGLCLAAGLFSAAGLILTTCLTGCGPVETDQPMRTITDQLGRQVTLPVNPERIAALHHFGGKIVFALNHQHLLVEKSIYGMEAKALAAIDPAFASLPGLIQGHGYNIEGLVSLAPQVIFSYASMDRSELAQFENAGIPVVAVRGETFEESFEAVRLMADVLECPEAGQTYITACNALLDEVAARLENNVDTPVPVLFAGPRSVYSVATGNMLQTEILARAGARNVAQDLEGFWADVSPEQIARWDPQVIFLGSYLDVYGKDKIFTLPQFQTVSAIKNRQVYTFPSNVGWWDYPAPHCVLGVVWTAKTLYPQLFEDLNLTQTANDFYSRFMGYSFGELGGQLQ